MTRQQLLLLAIETAPVDWQDAANRWTKNEAGIGFLPATEERGPVQCAVRELDAIIERLARFREYIDQRDGAGCVDQGHAAAVKASNKIGRKIRKALGFTYPNKGDLRI